MNAPLLYELKLDLKFKKVIHMDHTWPYEKLIKYKVLNLQDSRSGAKDLALHRNFLYLFIHQAFEFHKHLSTCNICKTVKKKKSAALNLLKSRHPMLLRSASTRAARWPFLFKIFSRDGLPTNRGGNCKHSNVIIWWTHHHNLLLLRVQTADDDVNFITRSCRALSTLNARNHHHCDDVLFFLSFFFLSRFSVAGGN